METVRLFVSHSRADERWVLEGQFGLIPWLAKALRRDDVEFWCDPSLRELPGEDYKVRIKAEIAQADFAVLLISQNFVISDFIHDYEIPWIRERLDAGKLSIIPILVGPVIWDDEHFDWLSDRQMLPGKPTPLVQYIADPAQFEQVRVEILAAIKKRVSERRKPAARSLSSAPSRKTSTPSPEEGLPIGIPKIPPTMISNVKEDPVVNSPVSTSVGTSVQGATESAVRSRTPEVPGGTAQPLSVRVGHAHGYGGCQGWLNFGPEAMWYHEDRDGTLGPRPYKESVPGHDWSSRYNHVIRCEFIDNTDGHDPGRSNFPWMEVVYNGLINHEKQQSDIKFVFWWDGISNRSAALSDFRAARIAFEKTLAAAHANPDINDLPRGIAPQSPPPAKSPSIGQSAAIPANEVDDGRTMELIRDAFASIKATRGNPAGGPLVEDVNSRRVFSRVWSELGSRAIPVLVGKMEDKEWLVRWKAMKFLAYAKYHDVATLRALWGKETDVAVRWEVLEAIKDAASEDAVRFAVDIASRDDSGHLRHEAVRILATYAQRSFGHLAVPAMCEALDDNYWLVRREGVESLRKIHSAHVLGKAAQLLAEDDNNSVRVAAAGALSEMGPLESIDAVLLAFTEGRVNDYVLKECATTYAGRFGPDAVRARSLTMQNPTIAQLVELTLKTS